MIGVSGKMPFKCCVNGCNYKSIPGDNVVMFSLPEELNQQWISFINRENFVPLKSSRICSSHFSAENRFGDKQLVRGAVPTIPPLPPQTVFIKVESMDPLIDNLTNESSGDGLKVDEEFIKAEIDSDPENFKCTDTTDTLIENENIGGKSVCFKIIY